MKTLYLAIISIFIFGLNSLSADELPKPQGDTILLSESEQGDYLVRRYLVRHNDDEARYSLKYSISATRLNSLIAGNAEELAELDKFMADIQQDTSIHLQRIEIVGYASPDGNARSNETLALSRAQKFRNMLDSRFNASTRYKVQLSSAVEPWKACDDGVEKSAIADKQKVLDILNLSSTPQSIESQLKAMPTVWSLFRNTILPSLRRVDMTAYYNTDTIFELRTLIEKPEPQPATAPQKRCSCPVIVEDEMIGIIVDMHPAKRHHKHNRHCPNGCR